MGVQITKKSETWEIIDKLFLLTRRGCSVAPSGRGMLSEGVVGGIAINSAESSLSESEE